MQHSNLSTLIFTISYSFQSDISRTSCLFFSHWLFSRYVILNSKFPWLLMINFLQLLPHFCSCSKALHRNSNIFVNGFKDTRHYFAFLTSDSSCLILSLQQKIENGTSHCIFRSIKLNLYQICLFQSNSKELTETNMRMTGTTKMKINH